MDKLFDLNKLEPVQNEDSYHEVPIKEQRGGWDPYVNNGGTVLAIGGKGFYIVAGDTRISKGYGIVSRNTSKIVQLTSETFMASSGMNADFVALQKNLQQRLTLYNYDNGRDPDCKSVACLLSRTLYGKRMFPYYTFNLLAGFDKDGNGITYGYDAVGSYDTKQYVVLGSGAAQIMPVLDCQLEGYNKINQTFDKQNIDKLIEFVVDMFNSATERDIYTGDQVEVYLVQQGQKAQKLLFPLRRD